VGEGGEHDDRGTVLTGPRRERVAMHRSVRPSGDRRERVAICIVRPSGDRRERVAVSIRRTLAAATRGTLVSSVIL
jgi:hypothetical protein